LNIPYKENCKDFLWLAFKLMMTAMAAEDPTSIQTRPSLLIRLKSGDDESWQDFYRIYGKIVRDFAIQAGLTGTEADEVMQETAIAMARHLPGYNYDPKVCRFKTWLLNQASWKIKDQLKKRKRETASLKDHLIEHDNSETETINRVPDVAASDLEAMFEAQWRKNLFDVAMERVKVKYSPKQFQIFDLLVYKEWPAAQVAKSLRVNLANVYVIRHRISSAIRKEIKRLEKQQL
jgi:RNA polymerase sigma factor (sigma-70 family)